MSNHQQLDQAPTINITKNLKLKKEMYRQSDWLFSLESHTALVSDGKIKLSKYGMKSFVYSSFY